MCDYAVVVTLITLIRTCRYYKQCEKNVCMITLIVVIWKILITNNCRYAMQCDNKEAITFVSLCCICYLNNMYNNLSLCYAIW